METKPVSSTEGSMTGACKPTMITVDYYEMMKFTHWNPKFHQLAAKLGGLLLRSQYSRTTIQTDAWPLAQLVPLQSSPADSCDLSLSNSVAHTLLSSLDIDPHSFGSVSSATDGATSRTQQVNDIRTTIIKTLVQFQKKPDQLSSLPSPLGFVGSVPLLSKALTDSNVSATMLPTVPVTPIFPTLYTPSHPSPAIDFSKNLFIDVKNSHLGTHNAYLSNSVYLNPLFAQHVPHFIKSPFESRVPIPLPVSSIPNTLHQVVSNASPYFESQQLEYSSQHEMTVVQVLQKLLHTIYASSPNETQPPTIPVPWTRTQSIFQIPRVPQIVFPTQLHPSMFHAEVFSSPVTGPLPMARWRLPEVVNLSLSSHLEPHVSTARLDVLFTRDEAKTRFMCSACGRQWTSMKGSISFVVILSHSTTGPIQSLNWTIQPGANVFFELFPQSCSTCDVICQPKWYPEEIDKVIRNLFVRIHEQFYQGVIPWDDQWDWHRRDGQPSGPHNSHKCVACQNGLCRSSMKIQMQHNNTSGHNLAEQTKQVTPSTSTSNTKDASVECVSGASSPSGPPSSKRRSTITERQ